MKTINAVAFDAILFLCAILVSCTTLRVAPIEMTAPGAPREVQARIFTYFLRAGFPQVSQGENVVRCSGPLSDIEEITGVVCDCGGGLTGRIAADVADITIGLEPRGDSTRIVCAIKCKRGFLNGATTGRLEKHLLGHLIQTHNSVVKAQP